MMKNRPITLGITGSIGMGKSTVCQLLRTVGVPVFDSDAAVHDLYNDPKIIQKIAGNFKAAVVKKKIDRQALGRMVFANPKAKQTLEKIIHPAVGAARLQWLDQMAKESHLVVAFDIPLLFEKNLQNLCDQIWVVHSPVWIQRRRLVKRGLSDERINNILSHQMPSKDKCALADVVIYNGLGLCWTRWQVKYRFRRLIMDKVLKRK